MKDNKYINPFSANSERLAKEFDSATMLILKPYGENLLDMVKMSIHSQILLIPKTISRYMLYIG